MLLQLVFRTFIASGIDKNTDVAGRRNFLFLSDKKQDLLLLALKDSMCFYIIFFRPYNLMWLAEGCILMYIFEWAKNLCDIVCQILYFNWL
jgi:hypothetical protein